MDIANTIARNNATSQPTSSVESAVMQDIWREIAPIDNVALMPGTMFLEGSMDPNDDLVVVTLWTEKWRYVFPSC